nr:retrovirus-related Pol polyprotein from transposon TNT 1-94 [Tanacetum cinerariifolium]
MNRFIRAIHSDRGALDNYSSLSRRSPWIDMAKIWLDKVALKLQYPRLYSLESHKKISVAAKIEHVSLDFSYIRAPRGGVKEEQQLHILSITADLLLPYMLDHGGLEIPSILCSLCSISAKSTFHLFFPCSLARQVRSKTSAGVEGLAECKALGSNLRRIQVKYIIKEVKDHLKIYSLAERDNNWYVEGIHYGSKESRRYTDSSDGDERKHVLDYTHVDLHYVEDQRKNSLNKFNLLKQELFLHKSELCNLKNTVPINCSLQNEVIRVNLENESLKDEIFNLKKALGGRGKRKDKISSKEVIFTKADESSSILISKIASDSESECETREPLPPIPDIIGAAPAGTSNSLISLSNLTLNMADLSLNTSVPKMTRPTFVKVSPAYVIKIKTKNKSPAVPKSFSDKKVDSSTKYPKEFGPKGVFRDDSSGDTKGYGSVNYNGITFTRVAYVNGLKHNLINVSQLKMENLNEVRVKELRSDNGTEFKNHKLEEFYDKKDIS